MKTMNHKKILNKSNIAIKKTTIKKKKIENNKSRKTKE